MDKQNTEHGTSSSPCWETLETWARTQLQTWVQDLLEAEVTELLGRRNWWMPGWLDRVTPHLAIERRQTDQSSIAATGTEGPATDAAREPAARALAREALPV